MRHQHGAVGEVVGLLEVVRGEDDRRAARGELAHRRPEGVAPLDVHRDRRLVEHQQVGVADQRAGEAHALGLAAGELLGALRRGALQPGQLQHLVDAQRPRVERGHHRHQLAHGEVAQQAAGLQHRADAAGRDRVGRRAAEERHRPGVGLGEPEQHVDGGGLAGAVGAEQRDRLARRDRDVDAAHRADGPVGRAEGLDQPLEVDPGLGRRG